MTTLAFLTAERQAKTTSLERLRWMLFGTKTEKTRTVLKDPATEPAPGPETAGSEAKSPSPAASEPNPKAPGHGHHGVSAYTGARQVAVEHPALGAGTACPHCTGGTLYRQNEPGKLVRITGMAPLSATVYACARLRCHLCGEVTTAPPPEGVGPEKYDATATSMVGLLKYGAGLPFNRIETLQAGMRIPLPAATQWDLVREAAQRLVPAHAELVRQAAQAPVLTNDDTTMKILQLTKAQRAAALADDAQGERTAIFTSGIVATEEGRQIALFFTGVRHAGENLATVLQHRAADLPAPSPDGRRPVAQRPEGFDTVMSSCLAHARRESVELIEASRTRCASCSRLYARPIVPRRTSKPRVVSPPKGGWRATRPRAGRAWRPWSRGCGRSLRSARSNPTRPWAQPSVICKSAGRNSPCSCVCLVRRWTIRIIQPP